jgi:DNA polymerase-3 subunit alpha (Gram-positive type)
MEPITNPLIDTMVISRSINPAQTRHNLGVLSRNLKLKYDETTAHRADFDAEVLYTV